MKKSELRKIIREVISEQMDPGKAVSLKGPKPSPEMGSPQWACNFITSTTTPSENVWCTLVPPGQTGQYYSEEECIAAGCVSEGSNPDGYTNWGCYTNGNCVPQVNGPFQSEQECVNAGCGDPDTGGTATGNLPLNNRKKDANKIPSPRMNPIVAKKRARARK